VSPSSPIADHCSTYALSDPKEAKFSNPCDHSHEQACPQCDALENALQKTQDLISVDHTVLDDDELVDLQYTSKQAAQDILAWKAHQLRSIRQDTARVDSTNRLDSSSILITNDWAMKFLPQKYRESQTDWFAKRGISWHISVALQKTEATLKSQTFVHIVQNGSQDAPVVIRIVEHVLRTIKAENQHITAADLRQDNAGCYHCGDTLTAYCYMKPKTGIRVVRVDFSDPQGGKAICDRKAATIKAHVRRYINEGPDVTTAREFKEAILSYGGVPGVRVALVDAANLSDPAVKWEGISLLNNFQFEDGKITVWRAYEIDIGKTILEDDLQGILNSYSHSCFSY
jgi:hypothetical protein